MALLQTLLKYKWWILTALAVVAVIVVASTVFGSEGFTSEQPASLVLFYSHDCGHCQEFLPKWKQMAAAQGGSQDVKKESDIPPKGNGVELKEVNCDKHTDLAQKHQIEGVPTMILFKGGVGKVYNGPRDEKSIKAFVANN